MASSGALTRHLVTPVDSAGPPVDYSPVEFLEQVRRTELHGNVDDPQPDAAFDLAAAGISSQKP
jgi:hypothetical protein